MIEIIDNLWGGDEVEVDVAGKNVLNMDAAEFFTTPAALLVEKWRTGLAQFHFRPVKFVAAHGCTDRTK
jgi:hypothetical protein